MGMEKLATGLSRRTVLKGTATTLIVAAVTPAGMIIGCHNTWSSTAEALKPESFATLVQMSRDIYPHAWLKDEFYAAAVSGLDATAKDDSGLKDMLEAGVSALNKAGEYVKMTSEEGRIALLKGMASSGFFQKVRVNLVTGLYNNKEVWPLFGYEGESASKGGYLQRGFDDIGWL